MADVGGLARRWKAESLRFMPPSAAVGLGAASPAEVDLQLSERVSKSIDQLIGGIESRIVDVIREIVDERLPEIVRSVIREELEQVKKERER
jgi:hypothetical protein